MTADSTEDDLRQWIEHDEPSEKLTRWWHASGAPSHMTPITWAYGPGADLCRRVEEIAGRPALFVRNGQVRGYEVCFSAYAEWLEKAGFSQLGDEQP